MSSSFRLDALRTTVHERFLPAYESLGRLSLVYLLGSLVSGYTDQADLDLMMVWDDLTVPAAPQREFLVVRLDERQGVSPLVVDHLDIHLERIVLVGQEYNIAHMTLTSFEAMLQSILNAKRDGTERILDPLVATAGFAYGEVVLDTEALGQQWKSRLSPFPKGVQQACRRAVLVHRQEYLTALTSTHLREDWFKFSCTLVDAVRTTLRALFVLHEVYYPGDKWLRQAIVRFGLGEEVLACFDRLWGFEGNVRERARAQQAALSRLMDLVEGHEIDQP